MSADPLRERSHRAKYCEVRVEVTESGKCKMSENTRLPADRPAEVPPHTGQRPFASNMPRPVIDMLARAMRGE